MGTTGKEGCLAITLLRQQAEISNTSPYVNAEALHTKNLFRRRVR
jgi:hypothetical protein